MAPDPHSESAPRQPRTLADGQAALEALLAAGEIPFTRLLRARAAVRRVARRLLTRSGRSGPSGEDRELFERLIDPRAPWRETYLARAAAALGELALPEAEQALRQATLALRQDTERLSDDGGVGELERARLLSHWRFDLMVLEECARRCGLSSQHGQLAALESRVQEIGVAAGKLRTELENSDSRPANAEELLRRLAAPEACAPRIYLMRTAALRKWLARTELDYADPDLPRRLCSAIGALHLQLSMQLAQSGFGELRPELEAARADLNGARETILAGLQAHLDQLDAGPARALLEAWVTEATDAAADLLTAIEDLDLAPAVAALQTMAARIDAFSTSLIRDLPQRPARPAEEEVLAPRDELQTALRALRRIRKDLDSELLEKRLALRLERCFGRRFVTFFENLILVLILVVIGQLIYETVAAPGAEQRFYLTALDTAICAVFLLEFGVKIGMASDRRLYFRRHWLIDLLPAIPFALVSELIFDPKIVRSLRFLRLPRLVRYVRIARPLIRILRLLLFLLRGMDRLVRRNAPLLNRSILFCSDPLPPAAGGERIALALSRARGTLTRAERAAVAELPAEMRLELLEKRTALLASDMRTLDPEIEIQQRSESGEREIDVETVIREFVVLDAATVVDVVGNAFARQLERALRLFRLPVIRRLPIIHRLVGSLPRDVGTAELVAHVGRQVGLLLDRVNRIVLWFRDLHGTITGPQFIDKLGSAMVKTSARPAKRLLGFGTAFLLLTGLALLTGVAFLISLTGTLAKFLGLPILILGAVALIVFALGSWMRRVAGSATDFFETIADAQFLSLTNLIKRDRREDDLEFLRRRVIEPENHLLAATSADGAEGESSHHEKYWQDLHLLYTDFEQSAPLTRGDVKIGTYLMGNLSLQNALVATLALGKRERKALQALDPARRSLLGPALWFHFITSAISQKVARLVVDYDRHCIPLEDLGSAPVERIERFRQWLEARAQGLRFDEDDAECEGDGASALAHLERVDDAARTARPRRRRRPGLRSQTFSTTEFHALHFLSHDPARDRLIRERFGDEVAHQLEQDRRALIREVFGTDPMSGFTREQLAFNPYRFYFRWLSGGKILLLPLLLGWGALRLLALGMRRTLRVLREILDPSLRPPVETRARSRYDIALRKIHRMRRPLYMACLQLRARLDPEYHGLALPGLDDPSLRISSVRHDLAFIDASPDEREALADLGHGFADALRDLEEFLAEQGLESADLVSELRRRGAPAGQPAGEQLRAATLAYLSDRHRVRQIVRGIQLRRAQATRKRRPRRAERRLIKRVCELDQTVDPVEYVMQHLSREAARCTEWTDQLLAVRAIQSLTVLDLDTYQDMIWQLGEYSSDGHPRMVSEPPGLTGAPPASIQLTEKA